VIAQEVLALPMHPYLAPDLQDRIIQTAREALAA
jgi:dTDP-4-amino-4,6-dideoxygalactose transaminase